MSINAKNGPGPGIQLWKGTFDLGANVWTSTETPHPEWAVGLYRVADDFSTTSGYDNASATLIEDTGAVNGMILLPTLGFHNLHIQLTNVDGASTAGEPDTLGVLWRGISKEGVL